MNKTQKTPPKILKSIVNPNLFVDMQKEKGGKTLRLTVVEPKNTGATNLKKFHITGIPADSIAFSLDNDQYLKSNWLLNENIKKLNKKCDIVVISQSVGKLKVLIGELKSQRPKESNFKFQMINSQLIVDYIVSLVNEYFFSSDIIIEHRLVVFTNSERVKRNLNKRGANQKTTIIEKRNSKIGNYFYVENDDKKSYDEIQSKTNDVWKFNNSIVIQLKD